MIFSYVWIYKSIVLVLVENIQSYDVTYTNHYNNVMIMSYENDITSTYDFIVVSATGPAPGTGTYDVISWISYAS
jgi:hypothetical protein